MTTNCTHIGTSSILVHKSDIYYMHVVSDADARDATLCPEGHYSLMMSDHTFWRWSGTDWETTEIPEGQTIHSFGAYTDDIIPYLPLRCFVIHTLTQETPGEIIGVPSQFNYYRNS